MRSILHAILFGSIALTPTAAQTVIYTQTFNGAASPDLPPGWFANSSQVFTGNTSPSGGYAGASGGNNLTARNCIPDGEFRSFQVDGISTMSTEGLTISFGHRRTNAFIPDVSLEWSTDGASWNTISYNSAAAGTSWSLFTSATLPVGAEGQPGLSIRWSYTTNVGNVPCDNFAGNYRIDDVKISAATVLPVRLASLKAVADENQVHLSWRTFTEAANDHFSVERSADGRAFTEIGRVPGAGTTYEPHDYEFTDGYPLSGINYYRLRQVDLDDAYSYSPVVAAVAHIAGELRLFPQPASDVLNIQLEKPSEESAVFDVFDPAGRLLLSGELPEEIADHALNVARLPEGIYTLRLTTGGEMTVRQFHKH